MRQFLRFGLLMAAFVVMGGDSVFSYTLERSVVNSGSGASANGHWTLHGTSGQNVVGHSLGVVFEIHLGFWHSPVFVSGVETPAVIFMTNLGQNYPNPFNPMTTIPFSIGNEKNQRVSLVIYDLRGALVRTLVSDEEIPGKYRVRWDGTDQSGKQVAAGVYLARLVTDHATFSRKILLVK